VRFPQCPISCPSSLLFQVLEPRFLAFLALKFGKTVRDPSLNSDLKNLLQERLNAYPNPSSSSSSSSSSPQSPSEAEGAAGASLPSPSSLEGVSINLQAGLGVGGGAGAGHPANKLVAKEKLLLSALMELL